LNPFAQLRGLTGPQWRAFTAAYLGWMLDAFDYFLVVMVVGHIADEFHTGIKSVTYALFLTLAMRPIGALVFGLIADRFGRRPALMGSILLYAAVELLCGFAPSLGAFLVLRAIFGIGMGGEWGVGASLAMESVPDFGWRGMFILGSLPALLVLFIRMGVQESPAWIERRARPGPAQKSGAWAAIRERWPLFLYMIALMTAFNAFSHGTQDLYPGGFLAKQRGLALGAVTLIVVIYNVGAIAGGVFFGAVSQAFGRRRTIAVAALLAVPVIPFWIGAASVAGLAASAFLIQFAVQGAWGVVPAHLNELSPPAARGTFPGLAYQLGNLGASYVGTLQATIADSHGGSYSFSLGWVVAVVAVVLAVLALAGPEARGAELSGSGEPA
jgi:MFS transporter, SHS family, lactate transporter